MQNHAINNTLMLWMLIAGIMTCTAEKLTPGQKAPPHATNSGGVALKTPLGGQRAADVGSRLDVGRSGSPSPPKPPASPPREDGVIREETEDIKEVDGKPVRVVKGRLAYDSPEGLGVSIKYEADENGNRASFTIGKPSGGGSGAGSKPNKSGDGSGGRPGGSNRPANGGGAGKGTTYLPPMNADKSYLPPS